MTGGGSTGYHQKRNRISMISHEEDGGKSGRTRAITTFWTKRKRRGGELKRVSQDPQKKKKCDPPVIVHRMAQEGGNRRKLSKCPMKEPLKGGGYVKRGG